MLEIEVNRDEVHFGASMTVRFMRTLRVPNDGHGYPSLPTFGEFPVFSVQDCADRVPAAWRTRPGLFIPMHLQEAMWISMSGRWWKPNAVKVAVAGINALTGKPWHARLVADPQDYLVCPEQNVLSGFNDREGRFRQFVTPPTRTDPASGAELAESETCEGLQIMVFEPRPRVFPDYPSVRTTGLVGESSRLPDAEDRTVTNDHAVLPDPHGIQTWDSLNFGRVCIHIVSGAGFREITGSELPSSPIHQSYYAAAGLPWPKLSDKKSPSRSDRRANGDAV